MRLLILFFAILICSQPAKGKEKPRKFKLYTAKITPINEGSKIKGIFFDYNDSTVLLINTFDKKNILASNYQIIEVSISDTKKIKIRAKGKIAKSGGYGFASGFLVGGIIGWSSACYDCGNNFQGYSKPLAAIVAGVPLGLIGAGIGALIGAGSHSIEVNGNIDKFLAEKAKLRNYVLTDTTNISN